MKIIGVPLKHCLVAESGKVVNLPLAKNDCQKNFIIISKKKWVWPMNMGVVAIRDGSMIQLSGGVGS